MNAQKKLVFENKLGEVVRVFDWQGSEARVIQRLDSKRIGVYEDTKYLDSEKIDYIEITKLNRSKLEKSPVDLAGFGSLKLIEGITTVAEDAPYEKADNKKWLALLASVVILGLLGMGVIVNYNFTVEDPDEAVKEIAAKIIKNKPKRQRQVTLTSRFNMKKTVKPKVTKRSVKRIGALAALGSLSKSKQRGGLNLGAVKTSAGPGLGGGTRGSGGVQTSLYAKGIVAAPLGVGGNIKGAGGYGTKGKGGGRAGYGKLSLIGSSGTKLIPLGKESIIEGGLDQDLISSVIQRNMGQIRFCYEQGLQTDPSIAGRVAVKFVINGAGRVSVAGIANTTMNSKQVQDCMLMRLRSWKFPIPDGGVDVKVSYPFVLRRAGRG